MRYAFRTGALAVVAALAATVVLFRPGAEPAAAAAEPTVNADLALVPADAVGFIHVRAADLWKTDIFAGFRQMFERAGPKALAALDAQFVPKVSTFDRVTGFLLLDERQRPVPYVVLQFTAPFKPAEVVNAYLPTPPRPTTAARPSTTPSRATSNSISRTTRTSCSRRAKQCSAI